MRRSVDFPRLVVLVGRLMDEPKLKLKRRGSGGTPFLKMKLAIARQDKQERTATRSAVLIEASVRGRLAEVCAASLRKGQSVAVAGSLRSHSDGKDRPRLEVIVDRVQVVKTKRRR